MSLERHYRRLLLAYPRSYRERRGDEIIATLLEDARPGQRRPDRHEIADLLSGGLRERLGLHDTGGFMAGAALVSPVCLTVAAAYAVAFWLLGARSAPATAVALGWILAVVIRAVTSRWSWLVLVAAVAATVWATAIGLWMLWMVVAAWGLVAAIGEVGVAARPVRASFAGRFGPAIAVPILAVLTVWLAALTAARPGDGPAPPVWSLYGLDLLSDVAIVAGVALAAWRRDARLAWAAFLLYGAWAVLSPPSGLVRLADGLGVALYGQRWLYVLVVQVVLVVLTIYFAVAARRRGGSGLPALHRAGGVAIGFIAGAATVALAVSLADRDGSVAFAVVGLGALIVPAFTDRWVPAAMQRLVLAAALTTFIVSAVAGLRVHPSFVEAVAMLTVVAVVTRDSRVRDLGAVAGWLLATAGMVMVLWIIGGAFRGSVVILADLDYAWSVGLLACLGIGTVVQCAVVVFLRGDRWLWRAPIAFVVAVMWLAVPFAVEDLPRLVAMATLALVGLVAAHLRIRVRRRGDIAEVS